MADQPKTTDQGIQANVPPESEHLPGAVDPDSSEPQIPRVASTTVGPGDVAWAKGDEPVGGAGRAADARDPATDEVVGPDGRPMIAQPAPEPSDDRLSHPLPTQQQQAQAAPGPQGSSQETSIEGPGYPTEDMSDIGEDEMDEDDDPLDVDQADADASDDEFADVADNDDDVQQVAPPELGSAPIEEEDGDTSILGDGHAGKAAWNRERLAALQDGEEASNADTFGSQAVLGHGRTPDVTRVGLGDEAQVDASRAASAAGRTPGSSEDMGYGGGAPNEDVDPDVPGLDTGDGRLDELAEETDTEADENLGDAADAMDDDTNADEGLPGQSMAGQSLLNEGEAGQDAWPDLPEGREQPDEGVSPEDRVMADADEDGMFVEGDLGQEDDLEMEELNEMDDIAADFEDQRAAMDDAADGNEERAKFDE